MATPDTNETGEYEVSRGPYGWTVRRTVVPPIPNMPNAVYSDQEQWRVPGHTILETQMQQGGPSGLEITGIGGTLHDLKGRSARDALGNAARAGHFLREGERVEVVPGAPKGAARGRIKRTPQA